MSTTDRPAPVVPTVGVPLVDASARTVARRRDQERNHRAELDQRAASALAARLAAMPDASAELTARLAECQRRRSEDRCPGRCVIRDRLRGAGRHPEQPL